MPKDRTRGKAGHSAGAKRDKAIRAARAEVEKRQRQLAGAMADLAALEAHQAGQGTMPEPVVPTDEPGPAPADDAPADLADVESGGSGHWAGESEPATAEAPESSEAHDAAGAADDAGNDEAPDSADSATAPESSESSDAAEPAESSDSALIG